MGAKAEAFAKQFEAKVEEATTLLEKLTDADWKKTTSAEKWTVALTETALRCPRRKPATPAVVLRLSAVCHCSLLRRVDQVPAAKPLSKQGITKG